MEEEGVTDSWMSLIAIAVADAQFQPPAQAGAFAEVEAGLGFSLPDELKGFLLETNGLIADFGADVVWSLSEILRRNVEMRGAEGFKRLYMPFDNLLFFGDDGDGDLFAFPVQADGCINQPDIFRWDHETDGRVWFAPGLRRFFDRRFAV